MKYAYLRRNMPLRTKIYANFRCAISRKVHNTLCDCPTFRIFLWRKTHGPNWTKQVPVQKLVDMACHPRWSEFVKLARYLSDRRYLSGIKRPVKCEVWFKGVQNGDLNDLSEIPKSTLAGHYPKISFITCLKSFVTFYDVINSKLTSYFRSDTPSRYLGYWNSLQNSL